MNKLSRLDEAIAAGLAIPGLDLTAEQVKRYVEVVTHTGRKRAEMLGEAFSDVDFAMGAAVVLFATGKNGTVPPAWLYNPMRGIPIFEAE